MLNEQNFPPRSSTRPTLRPAALLKSLRAFPHVAGSAARILLRELLPKRSSHALLRPGPTIALQGSILLPTVFYLMRIGFRRFQELSRRPRDGFSRISPRATYFGVKSGLSGGGDSTATCNCCFITSPEKKLVSNLRAEFPSAALWLPFSPSRRSNRCLSSRCRRAPSRKSASYAQVHTSRSINSLSRTDGRRRAC